LTILDHHPFNQLTFCTAIEVYNTVSGTWSTKTFVPDDVKLGTADISASVIDGKIFVILQYRVYMYDPDTDTWTQRAQLPLSHGYYDISYEPVSVVVDGKIVVISAIPDPDFRGALFYNPKTDVWSKSEIRYRIPYFGGAGVTTGIYAPKKFMF
jgi:N-acetylneuraminic acid mutarotase